MIAPTRRPIAQHLGKAFRIATSVCHVLCSFETLDSERSFYGYLEISRSPFGHRGGAVPVLLQERARLASACTDLSASMCGAVGSGIEPGGRPMDLLDVLRSLGRSRIDGKS
jgi:hypothetical protein